MSASGRTVSGPIGNAAIAWDASPISTARLVMETWAQIKDLDWSLVASEGNVSFWPNRLWPDRKRGHCLGCLAHQHRPPGDGDLGADQGSRLVAGRLRGQCQLLAEPSMARSETRPLPGMPRPSAPPAW